MKLTSNAATCGSRARRLVQSISDFFGKFFLLCFPVRFAVNHPEFEQVDKFHRCLFVTGAAGLEKSFAGFFSQLFDLLAKLQPAFMLQPLEVRVVEDR